MLTVLVKRLASTALVPVKGTSDSACFDLTVSALASEPDGWTVFTGLAIALPPGYAMLIYPRSGLSTKLGLTLRNTVGVIDSDYRGEILLKFSPGHMSHQEDVLRALAVGNRIAQGMIIQVPEVELIETDRDLPFSARGTGGFGSTDA